MAKISELKAKLSAHIEYVKHGEEVIILDRHTPVAKLVGIDAAQRDDARMHHLIASGAIVPAQDPDNSFGFVPAPVGVHPVPSETIDRLWQEERGDR